MDEMILVNMAIVKYTVKKFVDRNPSYGFLTSDLISHATLGLVKAVNRMAGIPDPDADQNADAIIPSDKPNPTSFIGNYVFLYIGRLLEQESLVRVPNRTRQDRKRKGKDLFLPIKEESIDSGIVFERDGLVDPRAIVSLMDEIYGCCGTETELEVIRHRTEGRTDLEIGEILGIPRSTVQLLRQGIYERFKARNDEYDTDD